MSAGERIYDLAAEPVKGTAGGLWEGVKKGALALGLIGAAIPLAIFGFSGLAVAGAVVLGTAGFVTGAGAGGATGGVLGGLGGVFNGVKKFAMGRDRSADPGNMQLDSLRQQVALEEARARALDLQQQGVASMNGANPGAASNNVDRLTTRQAEAAVMATNGHSV